MRVNGLAVRREPSAAADFVSGYRFNVSTQQEEVISDELRVDDGQYLMINDGPLVIDGIPWYLVVALYDADGVGIRSDEGWVAGGDGTSMYLVAEDPPPPPPDQPVYGPGPEPYTVMHGIGDAESYPFHLDAPVGIRWYAAALDGTTCRLTITLQPEAVEMVSTQIVGWHGGDEWWPQDYDYQEPLPTGAFWMDVDTDCSWSLRVHRVIG